MEGLSCRVATLADLEVLSAFTSAFARPTEATLERELLSLVCCSAESVEGYVIISDRLEGGDFDGVVDAVQEVVEGSAITVRNEALRLVSHAAA